MAEVTLANGQTLGTLQEPGCEALFETSREDNPHERMVAPDTLATP